MTIVHSVDKALALLQHLRDVGPLRITEAAELIGASPSTAHRLLNTLANRGFADQDPSRRYTLGPGAIITERPIDSALPLYRACRPVVDELRSATGETVHLSIRRKDKVHFIYSAESDAALRIGSRQGHMLPAADTASGRILLAELGRSELRGLYPSMSDETFDALRKQLFLGRQQGYAVNRSGAEKGVCAIAAALSNNLGDPLGAVSVSLPETRFRAALDDGLPAALLDARRRMREQVAHLEPA
ncbi:IclR family transcriptional regulator [Corynebacterium sp. 335C]